MAGRIWIPPYKPLGVSTEAVPGGGYINVDAGAGNFGPSPWMQVGLQAAEGAAGIRQRHRALARAAWETTED